jgi:hypothetical protein
LKAKHTETALILGEEGLVKEYRGADIDALLAQRFPNGVPKIQRYTWQYQRPNKMTCAVIPAKAGIQQICRQSRPYFLNFVR